MSKSDHRINIQREKNDIGATHKEHMQVWGGGEGSTNFGSQMYCSNIPL